MESYPQTGESVSTIEPRKKEKKDGSLRIRTSPTERYLVKKAVEQGGFCNVSTFFLWCAEHYPAIQEAETKLAKLKQKQALEVELSQ